MLSNRVILIDDFVKTLNPVIELEPSIHNDPQFLFFITLVLMLFVIINVRDFGAFRIKGENPDIDERFSQVEVDPTENRMVLADVRNHLS